MEHKNYSKYFRSARPDDLTLSFGSFDQGEFPLTQASIKTTAGFEDLDTSMVEYGSGILLVVNSERCCDKNSFFRPLEQRKDELAGYQKRSCTFFRNGDPNSNFLTTTGNGVIWIHNEGDRSLRFQTPDGHIYRVCTGYTEKLSPSNLRALISPIQVLLDLNSNPLDLMVSAVHVRYGGAPWQRGGIDCQTGAHVDSSFCHVFCGDDCLGVLEPYSDYFLGHSLLGLLDIDGYGPSSWFVRNKGKRAVTLVWPDGRKADAPADGRVYRLESLSKYREELGA